MSKHSIKSILLFKQYEQERLDYMLDWHEGAAEIGQIGMSELPKNHWLHNFPTEPRGYDQWVKDGRPDEPEPEPEPATSNNPLFSIGKLVYTPGARDEIPFDVILKSVYRHQHGDWGDVCSGDKRENELALKNGDRIFSVYTSNEIKFYVITEWDRSLTTVLLPEEY